jgi:prepilin-type N-terminal cleavage/methylation domain-containing protein
MPVTRKKNGFTLIELLIALSVAGIVSAAVVTLAYAVGTANKGSEDMSWKQAQLRYTTLRISELVRNCKLICGMVGDDLALWRADDNDDGQINPQELLFLEMGTDRNYIRMMDFPSAANWTVTLNSILGGTAKNELMLLCEERQTMLVPECNDVQIVLDSPPPWSRSVNMSFDLIESGDVRQYQINAALRGWAGNLLDTTGNSLESDDD